MALCWSAQRIWPPFDQRGFADSPLDDFMTPNRIDWSPKRQDRLNFRYSFEREKGIAPAPWCVPSVPLRSASRVENKSNVFVANYTRLVSARDVNSFNFSFSTFRNDTLPVGAWPAAYFPQHSGRRIVSACRSRQSKGVFSLATLTRLIAAITRSIGR
jgi:hypothetical protein